MRTELREIYDAVKKRVPKARREELPKIPGDSGASTDRVVVEERRSWIEKFFHVTFELLDDRMQYREAGRQGGENDWETTFARETYVVHRLAATCKLGPSLSANTNGMCPPSVVVSLNLKVDDVALWEKQQARTGSAPPRWCEDNLAQPSVSIGLSRLCTHPFVVTLRAGNTWRPVQLAGSSRNANEFVDDQCFLVVPAFCCLKGY